MAAINIVLNAVDKYSGTLTGLNQGLELVGKGLDALKFAAGAAFDAVSKGVELARIGGAFNEQRNQFENLAKSYKLNGQAIIDTVKETSANTISEFDSIAIATKAVAAGLQGKELNDALLYVKRWSEATGESFQGAAEKVFTSLSSGRYSVLRQMGLVIENGAKLNDVTAAMSEGLKRFGETGFNSADKLDALNASQDDLIRKFGQGINASKGFQSVLGTISDAVVKLVKDFDPAPIAVFVDLLVSGANVAAQAFFNAFPQIKKIIDFTLSNSGLAVKRFSTFVIDNVFALTKTIAEAINATINVITGFNVGNVFSKAFQSITIIVGGIVKFVAGAVSQTVDVVLSGFDNLFLALAGLADKFPSIFAELGFSGEDIRDFSDGIDTIRKGVVGAADGIGDFVFDASKKAALLADDFNKTAKSLRVDLGSIEEAQKKAVASLDAFEVSGKTAEIKVVPVLSDPGDLAKELSDKFAGIDAEIKGKISADVKVKLDSERGAADGDTVNESEIFAALVKIIKDALVGAAQAEGVPLAVTT